MLTDADMQNSVKPSQPNCIGKTRYTLFVRLPRQIGWDWESDYMDEETVRKEAANWKAKGQETFMAKRTWEIVI